MPDNWIWIVVVGVSGFAASRFWPFLETIWSADAKARRERGAKDARDEQTRYLTAIEEAAHAQTVTAAALDKIAVALDMFGRDAVARTFEISELRREMRDQFSAIANRIGGSPRRRAGDRVVGARS